MLSYPHKPEQEDVRRIETNLKRLFVAQAPADKAAQQKNGQWFANNARYAQSLAAVAYALEEPGEKVTGLLDEACSNLLVGLEKKIALSPADFGHYLSLALIANNEGLRVRLLPMQRGSYSNPAVKSPEAFFLAAEIQAALAFNRKSGLDAKFKQIPAALKDKKLTADLNAMVEALLKIGEAVAEESQQLLDKAFQARVSAYAKSFRRPLVRSSPESLLDIWGLGWAKIAIDAGLPPATESPYLPLDLPKE